MAHCNTIFSQILKSVWRSKEAGPTQVASAPIGHQKVHFEAPDAGRLETGVTRFFDWFNAPTNKEHFYSMSSQIEAERKTDHKHLQQQQRSDLDVTAWLAWFFDYLDIDAIIK